MVFKNIVTKLCLFSTLSSISIAAPTVTILNETALVNRELGDDDTQPIEATFDTSNWPNIAEQDCFAMLCLEGGKRVYHRVQNPGEGDRHYTESGARYVPFQPQQLDIRRTSQINPTTVSAEEFPWEGMEEGGEGAYVFPATKAEQDMQGVSLSQTYDNDNVPFSKWFRVTFRQNAPFSTYCSALFQTQPDFSVCKNDQKSNLFGTAGVLLANFAYQFVRGGPRPWAFIHAAGPNKGKYTKRSEDSDIFAVEAGDEPSQV